MKKIVLRDGPRLARAALGGGLLLVIGGLALMRGCRQGADPSGLEASRAFAAGRLDEAGESLGRWLAARPGSAEAHALKARLALRRRQPQEAVDAIGRAEALGLPAAEVDRLRGLLLADAGRHAEAEPRLRNAREADDRADPDVARALARAALETFRFGAAAAELERWRREAPDDPTPWLWQAEVDQRTNAGASKVTDDFRAALRLDPDLPAARLGLADALRREGGDLRAAADAYRQYLALRPDDPAGHIGAGLVALDLGELDDARGHLDRAAELDPKRLDAPLGLAALELRRQRPAAALEHLDRAASIEPTDPEVHFRRALALAQLGRADEAKAEREAAYRLRRDAAELEGIRAGLLRDPRDRRLQLDAARWLIDHGHPDEGIGWARKVAEEHPGDVEANGLLADYHERRNEPGLANFYRARAGH